MRWSGQRMLTCELIIWAQKTRTNEQGSTAFYENQLAVVTNISANGFGFQQIDTTPFSPDESYQNSPRQTHLAKAGDDTLTLSARLGSSADGVFF